MGIRTGQLKAFRATTALTLVLACAPAHGQQTLPEDGQSPIILDTATLIADRQRADPREVAVSVSVVEGDEIDRRGLDDMQKLVRYTLGVTDQRQTSATDPFNTSGGFTIRDVGGNRVQMLIVARVAPSGSPTAPATIWT